MIDIATFKKEILFDVKVSKPTLRRWALDLFGIDHGAEKGRGKARELSEAQAWELFLMYFVSNAIPRGDRWGRAIQIVKKISFLVGGRVPIENTNSYYIFLNIDFLMALFNKRFNKLE